MKLEKSDDFVSLLVVTLLASIFIGELLVMVLIDSMQPMSDMQEALFDSSLLSLLTYPLLYYMAFRPLRKRIALHEAAEQELFDSNHELQQHQRELLEKNFELKRANLALTESKHRFDNLFNFSPAGCLILSEEGVVQEANVTSEKLLGCGRSKILGRNFIAFIPHQEYGEWAMCLRNALTTDSKYSHKLIMKRDDGSEFYGLMTTVRGNPLVSTEIYAAFFDITQENWACFK